MYEKVIELVSGLLFASLESVLAVQLFVLVGELTESFSDFLGALHLKVL